MPATRLLYLCSLPHSGSTLLSLFLGGHSRLVGLGGIERSVSVLASAEGGSLHCTCGQSATECPYWGEVSRRLPAGKKLPQIERYRLALEVFPQVFGPEAWPVDSSKHIEQLTELRTLPGLDLRAIHLIKDIRSNAISAIDRARRKKGNRRPGWLLAIENFHRWRRENGKIDTAVERLGIPAVRVGYEELCLKHEQVLAAIAAALHLPDEPLSLSLESSRSHLIVGNRMRAQSEKQQLRYDNRWFSRGEWLPAAVLFRSAMHYNARAVYGTGESTWSR